MDIDQVQANGVHNDDLTFPKTLDDPAGYRNELRGHCIGVPGIFDHLGFIGAPAIAIHDVIPVSAKTFRSRAKVGY
jgi:hypothetical protein